MFFLSAICFFPVRGRQVCPGCGIFVRVKQPKEVDALNTVLEFFGQLLLWEWHAWAWVPILFMLVALIQLAYYWYFFSRIAFYQPGRRTGFEGPVSVVISARNEYDNLKKNLPLILEQDYPEFEVVVVNDGSDDDTEQLFKELKAKYKHLTAINLLDSVNFFKGKKLPLSVGIKSAKYEKLLLTDADCYPRSPHWIRRMADHFSDDKLIVLGYGAYEKRPGYLNKLIRLDTLMVAMQYGGFALAGLPYMGVGRNLAYDRKLFYRAKGFTRHYRILSGDDDLFINQVAGAGNTSLEISPQSHTLSVPKTSFAAWYRQKTRHLSTARYYRKKHRWLLGLFGLSQSLFLPLFIISLLLAGITLNGLLVLVAYLMRSISVLVIMRALTRRLAEKELFWFSMANGFLLSLISCIFAMRGMLFTRHRWK